MIEFSVDKFSEYYQERLKEIPNVVYVLVTIVPNVGGTIVPELDPLTTGIFFDISLADQYGKHSPASRNCCTSRKVVNEDLTCSDRMKIVGDSMLEELKVFVREGKHTPLLQEVERSTNV